MAQSQLSVLLTGKDSLTPVLKNVQKSLNDMGEKASKLDDIQKGFNKIQNSSAPLSKKIRDIRKQMESLETSGQSTSAEGQRMWREMSDAAKKYDETLKKIQNDTKSVGDSSKGSQKFDLKGVGTDLADKVGLGGVGSQIGAAIANPYVMASAAIAGAGKALYDYNVELDRSLQKTAQFTGLSGDGLMSLRNGIKSVADTFGKDYDTVLASVDGLMKQFHIDGEEALNIIRDGFVGGADDGGRMLDMISKYSGAFNDAGISAAEMVAIIGNTRSGIFSDEGMELFSKGATKIREFSDSLRNSLNAVGINADEMYEKLQSGEISTVEAIQKISSKLKELNPQSQEVGEVMRQVFGKQGAAAGYELVTALADVETNLEKVKEQTGDWGKAMEDLQQADREFENALSSLFGIADGGFSTMSTRLKADVYGAVAKVINGFIDLYNNSLVVRSGIAGIALQFKNAWEVIKAILKLFGNALTSLSQMIEGVLTLDWNKVKSGWKNGIENILKTVVTGFENIKENVTDAANQIQNGQIKRIEVPVETTYSENRNGGKGKTTSKTASNGGTSGGKTSVSNSAGNTTSKATVEDLKYQEGSLADLKKQYQEWQQMRDNTNWEIRPEFDYTDFLQKGKELEEKIKETEKKLGIKVEPTIAVPTELERKRTLLADSNSKASQVKSDYSNGLINADEAKSQLESIRNELHAQFPELDIDLHFNADGSITTLTEDIENAMHRIREIEDAVGSVGNMFSALGSAVGGAGGEIMNFAGQSVMAIAQIIPQIVSLIAAKNAEALASGTASAAAMPFPANLAAIATIIATIASVFSSLPQFEEGGIVGGTSYTGDNIIARLNSGEGVLTRKGINNLQNTLNDKMPQPNASAGGRVEFVIDGRQLKGVMKNVDSKIARQS